MALFTGMRQGEVLGLSWNNIDWKHNTINVRQQLQIDRATREYIIDTPLNCDAVVFMIFATASHLPHLKMGMT